MGTFSLGGKGTFGLVANQGMTQAKRLTELCIDHGVNLFDTAHMYSTGLSEEIVGEVLGDKSADILLTSKARMRIGEGANDEGLSRWHFCGANNSSRPLVIAMAGRRNRGGPENLNNALSGLAA